MCENRRAGRRANANPTLTDSMHLLGGAQMAMLRVASVPGDRFGRLILVALLGSGRPSIAPAFCRCDCGREFTTRLDQLRSGHTSSCGCSRRGAAPAIRFWAKVNKNGPVHPVLGTRCWLWTGASDRNGYGRFRVSAARPTVLSHRFAFELGVGPIPDDMGACHRCDHPPCVNPAHLFLGTQFDNMADAGQKGRLSQKLRTHCVHGHEFTEANTMVFRQSNGRGTCRHCRTCASENNRTYRRRRHAISLARAGQS